MATRHDVGAAADVPAGSGKAFEVGGARVAVFHIGDAWYAIGDTCPHRGGPLSEGMIDGTVVTCPWHGAEFDVCTGANLCPPAARPVPFYPILVENDRIQIETP